MLAALGHGPAAVLTRDVHVALTRLVVGFFEGTLRVPPVDTILLRDTHEHNGLAVGVLVAEHIGCS